MNGTGKVVCVTWGSGFIASWLIKLLLARGYSVHATVRSLDDPKKTEHLLALDGAKERLSLFEANLTKEGSFDSAFNGCECVFDMASPVVFTVDDPQAQLLDPAVRGTLNVLKSATRVPCLKKVVFTSSTVAVMFGIKLPEFGDVVDETWFSDPVVCEQKRYLFLDLIRIIVNEVRIYVFNTWVCTIRNWYALSKTLAEETVVKFSKENGLELVVINPGYVIGPLLQQTLNLTSEGFMSIIKTGHSRILIVYPPDNFR